MSLEQAIEKLTAAVEANTAALAGGAKANTGAAATTKPGATAKPGAAAKATPKAPTHTREELSTVLQSLAEKLGKEIPRDIIKEVGGVDKSKEIPDAKLDAVYEALAAKLAEEDGGGEEEQL